MSEDYNLDHLISELERHRELAALLVIYAKRQFLQTSLYDRFEFLAGCSVSTYLETVGIKQQIILLHDGGELQHVVEIGPADLHRGSGTARSLITHNQTLGYAVYARYWQDFLTLPEFEASLGRCACSWKSEAVDIDQLAREAWAQIDNLNVAPPAP